VTIARLPVGRPVRPRRASLVPGRGPRGSPWSVNFAWMWAVTWAGLDADAVVTGTAESGSGADIVAAGYAAEHVETVRVVFADGAWLEVPTRTVAEAMSAKSSRVCEHAQGELVTRDVWKRR